MTTHDDSDMIIGSDVNYNDIIAYVSVIICHIFLNTVACRDSNINAAAKTKLMM